MWKLSVFLCQFFGLINSVHFNGGSITWSPVYPYENSTTNLITITQRYSWTFPTITCANDVPLTTNRRSGQNDNLTCVVNCSNDGGYSTKPIDILTDCTSSSLSLRMMTSERSVNITLNANASFSIAYQGAAWRDLNSPSISGLDWSILCSIDLRKREDGFINTPPVASVRSPQYVFVNQTIQIPIPVSDVNKGDDLRCRWSIYRSGYRRKRSYEYNTNNLQDDLNIYEKLSFDKQIIHLRKKRKSCNHDDCRNRCGKSCECSCSICSGTNCRKNGNDKCESDSYCRPLSTTTRTTKITTPTTTLLSTSETPGTKRSTSSYIHRQAIDECGGICYPSSTPSGTTLSNCTITFTGLIAGAWYAVAVQVEDFLNATSNQSMSSVPIQFLINVLPPPSCSFQPVFSSDIDCSEVQINVPMSFQLYAFNSCDPDDSKITDILLSKEIEGMKISNFTSSDDYTYGYVILTWTPQPNQIGPQQFCSIAFTSERVQSEEYCLTLDVQTTPACTTTSTTSTSSTSSSTTSTTSSTSSTTTSTSSTSSTSSTTSSTTSTSSSTSTTSTTTSTATSTTVTTSTTTTTTRTRKSVPKKEVHWLTIFGLSLLALLMAICCSCCCLYYYYWGAGARRRRRKKDNREERNRIQSNFFIGSRHLFDQNRTSINTQKSKQSLNQIPQDDRTVHVRRITNSEKPIENGKLNLPSLNNNQNEIVRYSSAPVYHLKNRTNEEDRNISSSSSSSSTCQRVKRINVIQLSANKISTDETTNSINIPMDHLKQNRKLIEPLPRSNLNQMHPDRIDLQLPKFRNQSPRKSLPVFPKAKLNEHVTVNRISKKPF